MLQELDADRLWIADMDAGKLGFRFGARMTVVRLPGGGLFLHSPIALGADLRSELDRLGPVRCLAAPARFHVEHLGEAAAAYPEAKVYAVPGATVHLRETRLDGILGPDPEPEWGDVLEQVPFRGSRLYDEMVFFHRPSRTLILTDLCFNIPRDRGPVTSLVAAALGFLERFGPSRSFGLTVSDRKAARGSLERILAWDFDRVVIAHGRILESGGRAAFRAAFARFLE